MWLILKSEQVQRRSVHGLVTGDLRQIRSRVKKTWRYLDIQDSPSQEVSFHVSTRCLLSHLHWYVEVSSILPVLGKEAFTKAIKAKWALTMALTSDRAVGTFKKMEELVPLSRSGAAICQFGRVSSRHQLHWHLPLNPSLQRCEVIGLCCIKQTVHGIFLWHPSKVM